MPDGAAPLDPGMILLDLVLPAAALAAMLALAVLHLARPRPNRFLEAAPLVPLLAAPFYVLGHWAAMPTPVGLGSGGLASFLGWLTRYPNFGPINYEVGLGIACVVGTHLLPFAFSLLWLIPRKRPTRLLLALAAAEIVLYVPVLARLDLASLASIGELPAIWVLPSVLSRISSAIIMPLAAIGDLRRARRDAAASGPAEAPATGP